MDTTIVKKSNGDHSQMAEVPVPTNSNSIENHQNRDLTTSQKQD